MDDENVPQGSSDINIEVWVSKRKASSVESYHNEYVKKYGNDEYLSSINVNEDSESLHFQESPPLVCKDETCESDRQGQTNGPTRVTESTADVVQGEIVNQDEKSPVEPESSTEFWQGYGSSIYFHPMTCKTLPLKSVKSKQGNSQMLRFSKRTQPRKKRNSSAMRYRMDIPSVREILSSLGTLQVHDAEDGELVARSGDISSSPVMRTGNFVMSSESKNKLCKGFACRGTNEVSKPRTQPLTHCFAWETKKEVPIGIKVRKMLELSKHSIANSTTPDSKSKRQLGSLGTRNANSTLPSKFLPLNVYRLNSPSKKVIEGKTYHLTSSLQSINRVSLSPFKRPSNQKHVHRVTMPTSSSMLYPSPEPSDDEDSPVSPDVQVVADHLQEMKSSDGNGRVECSNVSNEEQYAYDSALMYYVSKVKSTEGNSKIDGALSATGLFSEKPQMAKYVSKTGQRDANTRVKRKQKSANDLRNVHVTGRNVMQEFPTAIDQIESSRLRNDIVEPLLVSDSFPSITSFPTALTHNNLTHNSVDYIEDSDLSYTEQFNSPSMAGKVVRFGDRDEQHFMDDISFSMPVESSPAKLVDRYEIPTSNGCRLPIIGQKITTKI